MSWSELLKARTGIEVPENLGADGTCRTTGYAKGSMQVLQPF